MDLLTYIRDTRRRHLLASKLNKNHNYLWQVATGRRRASTDLAKDIELETNGAVPKESLRPDVWQPEAA